MQKSLYSNNNGYILHYLITYLFLCMDIFIGIFIIEIIHLFLNCM